MLLSQEYGSRGELIKQETWQYFGLSLETLLPSIKGSLAVLFDSLTSLFTVQVSIPREAALHREHFDLGAGKH